MNISDVKDMFKLLNKTKVILMFFIIFSQNSCSTNDLYRLLNNGNIIAPDGTEYVFFASEGFITTFGEKKLLGKIAGEKVKLYHLDGSRETGMYSCDDTNFDILCRIKPDSEWRIYYRKVSLPIIDLRIKNCVRLEFISQRILFKNNISPERSHIFCNDGIINTDEINLFINELKNQKSPQEAGLYDMIRKENGVLENCYLLGCIYGYFDNETNLAITFDVWSFNDLAYSVDTDFGKYVLTLEWLEKLGYKK
jgi:hypothetical protein